jgi:hypothetical protein
MGKRIEKAFWCTSGKSEKAFPASADDTASLKMINFRVRTTSRFALRGLIFLMLLELVPTSDWK